MLGTLINISIKTRELAKRLFSFVVPDKERLNKQAGLPNLIHLLNGCNNTDNIKVCAGSGTENNQIKMSTRKYYKITNSSRRKPFQICVFQNIKPLKLILTVNRSTS